MSFFYNIMKKYKMVWRRLYYLVFYLKNVEYIYNIYCIFVTKETKYGKLFLWYTGKYASYNYMQQGK